MRSVGRGLPAAALVLVTGFAGTATAAQGGPLTKTAYIRAADNICAQADQLRTEAKEAAFAAVPTGGQPTVEEMTAFVDQVDPIYRQQIDSLRDLPAPKADKKRLKKIYKQLEKGVDAMVEDPSILLTSDPLVKADKAARKYGFEVCGTEAAV